VLAVRVQVIEESSGLARGAAGQRFTLALKAEAETSVRSVTSGVEGWVEAQLPLPARAEEAMLEVHEQSPGRGLLGRGTVTWSHATWRARATKVDGVVPAAPGEGLPITLRFEPPVFSVPFPGDVILELQAGSTPLSVRAEAHGAELLSRPDFELAAGRQERLRLSPREHAPTLTLHEKGSPRTRSVTLPVVPGSLTAQPEADHLIISSPVPRTRVYYSVVTEDARLGGGEIVLGPRPDGTATGRLARGVLPVGTDRYLVLSSTADGQAPALVGLPLDGQSHTFGAREVLLLDGRAHALRAAERTHARARWVLACYAGFGALLSLVLFVWHIRRANERLRIRLEEVGAPAHTRDASPLSLASAVLSLIFAFGLALTWILVR
jgi:hypothetical protein